MDREPRSGEELSAARPDSGAGWLNLAAPAPWTHGLHVCPPLAVPFSNLAGSQSPCGQAHPPEATTPQHLAGSRELPSPGSLGPGLAAPPPTLTPTPSLSATHALKDSPAQSASDAGERDSTLFQREMWR